MQNDATRLITRMKRQHGIAPALVVCAVLYQAHDPLANP